MKENKLKDLLIARNGQETIVVLLNGEKISVFNSVFKFMPSDQSYGISVNVKPIETNEETHEIFFFNSKDILKIEDPESKKLLFRNYEAYLPSFFKLIDKQLITIYLLIPSLIVASGLYFFLVSFGFIIFIFMWIHSATYLQQRPVISEFLKRILIMIGLIFLGIYVGHTIRVLYKAPCCMTAEKVIEYIERNKTDLGNYPENLASTTFLTELQETNKIKIYTCKIQNNKRFAVDFYYQHAPFLLDSIDVVFMYDDKNYIVWIPVGMDSYKLRFFTIVYEKNSDEKRWKLISNDHFEWLPKAKKER